MIKGAMVIRKGKILFTVMLTLVFCLTAVFPVAAAPPSAKDLVLAAVHNFDLGMNPEFFAKSEGEGTIEVTRFEGTVKETVGDYTGAVLRYSAAADYAQDAMKMSFDLKAKDIARQGDFYMQGDKLILSRDFFLLLQDLGADVFAGTDLSPDKMPALVYWSDPQFGQIWEQMADYQKGKLPAMYTDWLSFFIEAVPDECFTLSPTKVMMRLDGDSLVDTSVNLLTKVKSESERVADILLGANAATFEQMGLDPEEMKQEMIAGMQQMPLPSRDEVQAVMSVVEVNDFSLVYSLLPGGTKTLRMDLGFKAPDGSTGGSFTLTVDAAGTNKDLKGDYCFAASLDTAQGPCIALDVDGKVNYKTKEALSASTIDLTVRDNKTGALLMDLGLADSSVTKVTPRAVLDVPALTAANSLDLTAVFPVTGSAMVGAMMYTTQTTDNISIVESPSVKVGGTAVDGAKMGKDGQFVVPARAVLESMGYTVHWVPPNTLRVLGEVTEFTLVMDQKQYRMGNEEKELVAAPYLDDGKIMIPLGFLASEEVGAHIELS